MDLITISALQRVLAVVIGGLCIYLWYLLFHHISKQKESWSKINLLVGISIFSTRIGPGIFFALLHD